MPTLDELDDSALRTAVVAYRDLLRVHQDRLNRLNVYPVPDGDTGTNMALTVESVLAELESAPPGLAATCVAISRGSLMGARGNSGVILSQILRGLCGRLKEHEAVDGPVLAEALTAGATAAYEAVMAPVEGTILTVVREAAEAASARAPASLIEVVEAASAAARTAVEKTPELLPVLAAAGVVDSGGSGLALLLDALLHVVDGRPLPAPPADPIGTGVTAGAAARGSGTEEAGADGGPRYEVMYLLEAPDERIPGLKTAWAALGESIVVVGGEGMWNCHIHTDHIGASIEAGIDIGRPRNIAVADLCEQVAEEQWVRNELNGAGPSPAEKVATGVVAVGAGEGVTSALLAMGVQEVVPGGQTMNPSTREILRAVEAVAADGVIVLPNNRNIVATAEQVPELADRPVSVVPTRSLVEGVAALMTYDAKAEMAANVAAMTQAAAEVVGGEVVRAVRDARIGGSGDAPDHRISAGDHLGFSGGNLVVVETDVIAAACALLDRLVGNGHELVTVITGTDADESKNSRLVAWLADHRPDVTVEVHDWAYPHAAYLFSVE